MDIIDLYKSILTAASLTSDSEGYVSSIVRADVTRKPEPTLINGKRLVLPTNDQLRSPSSEKVIFHPLSENIMRSESEVITKLRNCANIRLNYTLVILVNSIIDMISSVDKHKTLTPDQSEILSIAADADMVTLDSFMKMYTEALKQNTSGALVTMFLKRGGIVSGKKYSRVGVIGFPFFKELQEEKETYYGVKLRKKDRQSLLNIFKYILPSIDEEGYYNRGSDSTVAPYLDAIMKAFMAVGSRFNDFIENYKDFVEPYEHLLINSEWVEIFDNLEVMIPQIRKIPVQAGNEGSAKLSETQNNVVQTVAQPPNQLNYITPETPAQPAWIQPQQMQQPAPLSPQPMPPVQQRTPPNTGGKLDFGALRGNLQSIAPVQIPPSMAVGMPQQQQYFSPHQQFAAPPMDRHQQRLMQTVQQQQYQQQFQSPYPQYQQQQYPQQFQFQQQPMNQPFGSSI